jgi:hypothetical protein
MSVDGCVESISVKDCFHEDETLPQAWRERALDRRLNGRVWGCVGRLGRSASAAFAGRSRLTMDCAHPDRTLELDISIIGQVKRTARLFWISDGRYRGASIRAGERALASSSRCVGSDRRETALVARGVHTEGAADHVRETCPRAFGLSLNGRAVLAPQSQ